MKKGLYLIVLTAIISGFSVFINKYAVQAIGNSDILATLKNSLVAIFICLLVFSPKIFLQLKKLSRQDYLKLLFIGLIGGSLPFLLFFKGLSLSSANNAAFIHKTLFIWVAILAVPFLKEKISKIQLGALGVLLVGNFLLTGLKAWTFTTSDSLILLATILWSVEFVYAKKLMTKINPLIIAWARMFFGSIILLGYLLTTNQLNQLANLDFTAWNWLILTSILLLGYVATWYSGLAKLPATTAASILVIASPITTALTKLSTGSAYTVNQLVGSIMIACACLIFFYVNNQNQYQTTINRSV